MEQRNFFVLAFLALMWSTIAPAQQFTVNHTQRPAHQLMVARSEDGKVIANVEFSQLVQGEKVTVRLTYRFVDGSIDDETTTYTQHGTFRLISNHHIQKGPFFATSMDFGVEADTGEVTTRTVDRNGKEHVDREHIDLPDDLANGFVGTLLLNAPKDSKPFRLKILAPVRGARVIQLLISQEGERPFQMAGHAARATVFRIHPELGGIVGVIAQLIGLQPKDVMVWVMEGDDPSVVRIIGQLGGYGPLVNAEMDGTSFVK